MVNNNNNNVVSTSKCYNICRSAVIRYVMQKSKMQTTSSDCQLNVVEWFVKNWDSNPFYEKDCRRE